MAHNILKGFLVFSCADILIILKNSVSKSLKFVNKWQFLYFMPILSAIFVEINAEILHFSHSSNKTIKRNL